VLQRKPRRPQLDGKRRGSFVRGAAAAPSLSIQDGRMRVRNVSLFPMSRHMAGDRQSSRRTLPSMTY